MKLHKEAVNNVKVDHPVDVLRLVAVAVDGSPVALLPPNLKLQPVLAKLPENEETSGLMH